MTICQHHLTVSLSSADPFVAVGMDGILNRLWTGFELYCTRKMLVARQDFLFVLEKLKYKREVVLDYLSSRLFKQQISLSLGLALIIPDII